MELEMTSDFLLAYFLTIFIEGTILVLLLRRKYELKLIIRNAIIASSLTLPFVWFFFPLLGLDWTIQTLLAELFAFATEAWIFTILFKGMDWKNAIIASFVANAVSFFAGFLLL
jgi:hypothetical protein